MIKALVKKPGKVAETRDFLNINEIYKVVANNGFVGFATFNHKNDIGMYYNDDGYLTGKSQNFSFNNNIVYGSVVFIGLDDEGNAKSLTPRQILIIENYLDHNICK